MTRLKDTTEYQKVLRAIGQGIEKLGVESFDLRLADDHDFVISGTYRESTSAPTPKAPAKSSLLRLIVDGAKKAKSPQTSSPLFRFSEIRFTRDNIDLLNRAGKASRWLTDGLPPSPLGIANVLRMVGAYLDLKHSRLCRLAWQHQSLTLWHTDQKARELKEIFTPENLFDHWVHHFKTRKPPHLLKPTGSD